MKTSEQKLREAMERYSETRPAGYSQSDFIAGWQAALAEQPAQSEVVAEIEHLRQVIGSIYDYAHKPDTVRRWCDEALSGIPYAPPAPAAPEGVAKDAARYRWLRDQKDDDGCVIVMKEKHIPRFVNYSKAIDDYIDAAMMLAAPEAPK